MRWDIARPEDPKTDVFHFLIGLCVCVFLQLQGKMGKCLGLLQQESNFKMKSLTKDSLDISISYTGSWDSFERCFAA